MTQTSRQPKYQSVEREADLEKLIPGDRVFVNQDDKTRSFMTYHRIDNGSTKSKLNHDSILYLIGVPQGYQPDSTPSFLIHRAEVRTLQFYDGSIHFDHLYHRVSEVKLTDDGYSAIKELVDLVQ